MPGPNFITQAELDQLRAEQETLINEIGTTGDVKRQSWVSDNAGGQTRTLTTVSSNTPMRLWISSGPNGTSEETRFWGEREQAMTDAFVVMAWYRDVKIQDVIIFDSREWRVVGLQFDDAFLTAKRLRVESLRA